MRALTYVSSALRLWSEPELEELLGSARAWNQARDLTGMLLYSGGNFIQTVEGPDDVITEVFARINGDARHRGLLVMLDEPVGERSFPDWTMGFRRFAPGDLDLAGHSDFLRDPAGASGSGDQSSAQRQLLASFRVVTR